MNSRIIISIFLVCLSANVSLGQTKDYKSSKIDFSKKQSKQTFSLERARALAAKSPSEAISMIEKVIGQAKEDKDLRLEAAAYALLGEIFEDADQEKLAIQRYEQAMLIYNKLDDPAVVAPIAKSLAGLYLASKNVKLAESYYVLCQKTTDDSELKLKCLQGMYDVRILKRDTMGLISDISRYNDQNPNDTIGIVQNYARLSQINVQQNDFSAARTNFKRAIKSLPKEKEITKEDYAPVQLAMDDILNAPDLNTLDKISIRNDFNIESPKLEPIKEILVTENMEIAELYLAENRVREAEKFIEVSKKFIDSETPANTTANVFKKSAEIAQKKGRMDQALADLDKYVEAKEKSIKSLEEELQAQIDIVTAQQKIDISLKDISINEKEEQLVRGQVKTQKIVIGLLSTLLIASLIFFYFLYKNTLAKREANQRLLLKSLRTQMNPHFIFNALNSVNNFIAKNDEKAANKFLSDFSRLMRKVLDYSQKDFITFEEEIELNELYLKLEHFRFRDKFEYQFVNKIEDQSFDLDIPPMLIQPFIENAVWHGLRYKESMGSLWVSVDKQKNNLLVTIKDDGIGRAKSKSLKTKNQMKYKSTGLDNVSKRINLINELYHKNYRIEVADADKHAEDVGTEVKIFIPIEN